MQKSKAQCERTMKPTTMPVIPSTSSRSFPYAVVRFLCEEDSFSEVPTNWIVENNSASAEEEILCWWPVTKNVSPFIENRVQPEKTWTMYEIEILKYCSSLTTARKAASDPNYITTDDDALGRGLRKTMPRQMSDSEYEEEEERAEASKKLAGKKNLKMAHRTVQLSHQCLIVLPIRIVQQSHQCLIVLPIRMVQRSHQCLIVLPFRMVLLQQH
ncbi:PREDICTED: uncharacterized protein LOC105570696 [Vollenhovia emeryi]|uniref:uncharacterized protein LOC105570696 n=1 Tax=Vollenhovia emeryi TaxID=411798 RepID=UPI0005F43FB2|nr:PREDICTED: uncharacterized protein LOC105570696 [Vollenhovia emeryi]